MKIKNGFILKKVSDAYVVIVTGGAAKDFKSMITLNEAGALLWKVLENGCDGKDALTDALTAEYEVGRDIAERDAEAFLAKLTAAGIIEA